MTKILKFKEEFRRAIEDGSKTQTRRPLDTNPDISWGLNKRHSLGYFGGINLICPYGEVGDITETNLGLMVKIISLRVERLHNISSVDARAEGVDSTWFWQPSEPGPEYELDDYNHHINAFRYLWIFIYGEGAWEANPLVWAIEFKRVEG